MKPTCSKCGLDNERKTTRRKVSYCLVCHRTYMQQWRKTHKMTPEQRKRDSARSYASVYTRRGKLRRKPCKVCGDGNSQRHHPDYDRPLHVVWLCRRCHLAEHAKERKHAARKAARSAKASLGKEAKAVRPARTRRPVSASGAVREVPPP